MSRQQQHLLLLSMPVLGHTLLTQSVTIYQSTPTAKYYIHSISSVIYITLFVSLSIYIHT
ncbi:hypothetical protein QBC41DRAFT_327137 [Cercophora samala]|uniref:Uncharacterized protein n=1 Tax=Cercophora samala TaxID=330535 RepID=A0AA39Z7S1_9PEZI|nr:hypothetical protein QBC41DRAFT_327137 [Cercophora samala]